VWHGKGSMLSDVLFETIVKIEEFQRSDPEWYEPYRGQILIIKLLMKSLQEELDRAVKQT
jgi:hypothetical protein